MKQTVIHGLPIYSFDIFEKYTEVEDATSTRLGGISKDEYASLNIGLHVGDELESVLRNRALLAEAMNVPTNSFVCGQQVHGTKIRLVTSSDKGKGSKSWGDGYTETDALITNTPGIPLLVVTADCAAVSLYDPENRAIGIAHAGRKGTEEEIVLKTIEKMHDTFETCAENLVVGIGPCICPACYPVDIPGTIKQQLIGAGVKPQNIESSGICTAENNDIFYSYRADNSKTGRFGNIVMLVNS